MFSMGFQYVFWGEMNLQIYKKILAIPQKRNLVQQKI